MRLTPLLALAIVSGVAVGQFDVNGPNAAFTVDGTVPSSADPSGHDVVVGVPGTLELAIESGANPNMGIIMLQGPIDPPATPGGGNVFATPWGGSLDIGIPAGLSVPTGLSLVLDGIGFSTGPLDFLAHTDAGVTGTPLFALSFWVGSVPATSIAGWQAIVQDPTTPFGLDNTEAADIHLVGGFFSTVYTMGDDTFLVHTLTNSNVTFGGTVFTELHISSNGYVGLTTANNDWTPTLAELWDGFQAPGNPANPGVAVMWSDLNRGGTASGGTYEVIENSNDGSTTVEFQNMNYWTSQEPAGSAAVEFGAGGVPGWITFDHSALQHGPTSGDAVCVGITDGDSTTGVDMPLGDLVAAITSGYTSFASPESWGWIVPGGTPFTFTSLPTGGVWHALDLGDGAGTPWFTWTLFD